MCHEAVTVSIFYSKPGGNSVLLGNSLKHRSRLKNEGRKRNAAEICARTKLRDNMHEY